MSAQAAIQIAFLLAEAGERYYTACVKAAEEAEKQAIADHLARTAAAHATIKSISFGEDA